MSKYHGLPDIDTAPDVYESVTSPRTAPLHDTYSDDSDDESEGPNNAIERAALDPHAAKQHFRQADPIVPEYTGQETSLARLLRLQQETQELETALAERGQATERANAAQLLAHLTALQVRIGENDASLVPMDSAETAALIRELDAPSSPGARSGKPVRDAFSGFDARLAQLEHMLGTPDVVEHITPMLETLRRLESQMSLLTQAKHMDAIVHRAKLAASELERTAEVRKRLMKEDGASAESLAHLDELYALQSRIEPLLPLAPALLSRLQTLAPLHASAADAASTMASVERESSTQRTQITQVREMLMNATKSLAENAETAQGNLRALHERLESLEARISTLSISTSQP